MSDDFQVSQEHANASASLADVLMSLIVTLDPDPRIVVTALALIMSFYIAELTDDTEAAVDGLSDYFKTMSASAQNNEWVKQNLN